MNTNDFLFKKRYQILIENEDLVCISTPQKVRKFVNKAYCTFFGKTESDLLGKRFVDNFDIEKQNAYNIRFNSLTPENPTLNTTLKPNWQNLPENPNNYKWVNWKETAIFDENGMFIELFSIGRVVDEIISVKTEKDEVTNLLQAYRDAIDRNIICSITDKNGNIIYANKHFCEVSKYNLNELIGKTHSVINSGYHPKDFFANMWQNIITGNMWDGEIRNKAKDGSYYWVNTVILPILNTKKQVDYFLSLRVLVTDSKLREEEKTNYLKSLEEMLFMISHELRKPISTSLGLLDILQSLLTEFEEQKTLVTYLTQSVNELDSYTRVMNDFIRANVNTTKNAGLRH